MLASEHGAYWALFIRVVDGPFGFEAVKHTAEEDWVEVLGACPLHLKLRYILVGGVPNIAEIEVVGLVLGAVYTHELRPLQLQVHVLRIVEFLIVKLAVGVVGLLHVVVVGIQETYP
jgi:hypothetical protein